MGGGGGGRLLVCMHFLAHAAPDNAHEIPCTLLPMRSQIRELRKEKVRMEGVCLRVSCLSAGPYNARVPCLPTASKAQSDSPVRDPTVFPARDSKMLV